MNRPVDSVARFVPPRSRSRRKIVAGIALGLVVVLGAVWLGLGVLVRSRVRDKLAALGAARGLTIGCGDVSLRFFGVRVREVAVHPAVPGDTSLDATVDSVEVDVSWTGAPREVRVRGGAIDAVGQPAALRERFGRHGESGPSTGASELHFDVEGMSVAWHDAAAAVQATGVGLSSTADGARIVTAQSVQVALNGMANVEARGGSVELVGSLVRAAHVDEVSLVRASVPASALPPPVAEPDAPLTVPWPDPAALRLELLLLAEKAAEHLTDDAALRVEGLRVELGKDLKFGPAPFRIQRRPGALVAELAPDAPAQAGATPLAFHVDVPLGDAERDPSATLEGGPVPLSLLGFRDGQLFLRGTNAATLRGRGKIVLGDPLRVDLSVDVAHFGIEHARLAPTPVDDVSFGLDVRGAISGKKELVLEDAKLRVGELVVTSHGTLSGAGPLRGHAQLEVGHVTCEGLHQAVPAALAPRLGEFRFAGDFAFSAVLDFDAAQLDDLVLDVRQMGTCRATATPEWAARRHLQGEFTHTVYDPEGKPRDETTGPGSGNYTPIDRISPFMQVAVLTSEDGGFFHHHGWNKNAIRRALIADLKAGRFRQGASTISMQLSKNLFLSRDKTVARKLEELVLTDYLEQTFEKSELMELYLNAIEFGPDVYGITQAAHYYYGREPEELTLAECMFLTSLLPSPVKRSKARDKHELVGPSRGGVDFLIRAAEKTGKISRAEMEVGLTEPIVFHAGGERPPPRPPVHGSRFEGDDADVEGLALPQE